LNAESDVCVLIQTFITLHALRFTNHLSKMLTFTRPIFCSLLAQLSAFLSSSLLWCFQNLRDGCLPRTKKNKESK